VSSDEGPPRARRSLSKNRMEGFSDGVFGVAITLLVFDLAVHPPGSALDQVLREWPSYLAYVVSFLTIGGAWLVHTAMTDRLDRADPILLRINLLMLMPVAFLPFPTELIAGALSSTSNERVFVTMYGLTLIAIRLLGSAMDAYAAHEHLYLPRGDDEEYAELHRDRRKLLPVVIGYAIAILLGLALPAIAMGFYLLLSVYLVVPFRAVARRFRRS
jgi:uncharacterized membrane protein